MANSMISSGFSLKFSLSQKLTFTLASFKFILMIARCNAYRAHRQGSESPCPGVNPGSEPACYVHLLQSTSPPEFICLIREHDFVVTNATGDYVIVGCSATRLSNKNDAEITQA